MHDLFNPSPEIMSNDSNNAYNAPFGVEQSQINTKLFDPRFFSTAATTVAPTMYSVANMPLNQTLSPNQTVTSLPHIALGSNQEYVFAHQGGALVLPNGTFMNPQYPTATLWQTMNITEPKNIALTGQPLFQNEYIEKKVHQGSNWRENHVDVPRIDHNLIIERRNKQRTPPRPIIEYPLSRCLPSIEEIPDATARLTETIRLWWIDNEGTALGELEKLDLQPQLTLQQWRLIALNEYIDLQLFCKIDVIMHWLKAFTIYSEAVLSLYPHRREEFDSYERHIVEKSDSYPFDLVFQYDQERRMRLCKNRQLTLMMPAPDLEDRYFYPIVEHRTGFISLRRDRWDQVAYDERGKEICNKYNYERCHYPYCKRSHVCAVDKCGGLHPAKLCPARKSAPNSMLGYKKQNFPNRIGPNSFKNNGFRGKGKRFTNSAQNNCQKSRDLEKENP
ncbi:hypothetical protein C2G38_2238023 [Gigaspora rosea]|uniref:C3H1-type domain-containing protein n=1 Tax=Gigaspora rosea TaxID=44941 RepID=A0A397WCR5_9GLOM|nr:hypothetical protein C2G38_2238023 [Gigaspora rosea]